MIRQLFLLCLYTAALAFGQQPTTQIPSNFVAMGGAYNPYTRPGAAGWASWGYLMDRGTATYLFTTEDFTSSSSRPYQLQTSIRVGIGTLIKDLNCVKLWGIIDGGGASSLLATGGAASGGGFATLRLRGQNYLIAGFRVIKVQNVPGTPKLYEFGYGWGW